MVESFAFGFGIGALIIATIALGLYWLSSFNELKRHKYDHKEIMKKYSNFNSDNPFKSDYDALRQDYNNLVRDYKNVEKDLEKSSKEILKKYGL